MNKCPCLLGFETDLSNYTMDVRYGSIRVVEHNTDGPKFKQQTRDFIVEPHAHGGEPDVIKKLLMQANAVRHLAVMIERMSGYGPSPIPDELQKEAYDLVSPLHCNGVEEIEKVLIQTAAEHWKEQHDKLLEKYNALLAAQGASNV